MLQIEPITADIIKKLNLSKSLEVFDELSPDDRELIFSKSMLVSAAEDTLVNAGSIPAGALEMLEAISGGNQAVQGELLIPVTLISGSMAYHVPHHTNKTDSITGLTQAPFFTFMIPFGHGLPSVQPDVMLKSGATALVTDSSTYFSICNRYPNLWMRIFQDRNRLITIFLNQYRVFASMNSDLRVAQLLHALSYSEGLIHEEVTVNTSQHIIADALSISRASVAKSLAKLYEHGVAKPGYRTITIYSSKLIEYINDYDKLSANTH